MPAGGLSHAACLVLVCVAAQRGILALAATGPTELSAADRGLTATDVKPVLLAQEGNLYFKEVTQKNFKGSVLGYVTPWNSHGYDVATRWRAKFTHISPVWYQLKMDEADGSFKLTGGHDVDQSWIAKLREPLTQDGKCANGGDTASNTCSLDSGKSQSPPLVVPRVIVELAPQALLRLLQQPEATLQMVVDEIVQQGLDGLVLEGWLQWSAMGVLLRDDLTQAVVAMVTQLADLLHSAGKVLLLAVPPVAPSPGRPGAEVDHLQQLGSVIDGFSLMTYDYSASGAGPSSPLPWQQQNVKELMAEAGSNKGRTQVSPKQVLMGLNWYGMDFTRPDQQGSSSSKKGGSSDAPMSANPILGEVFLGVLRKVKPKLKWEEQHAEHRIKYKDGGLRHVVYYPTPAALAARIKMAEELGVGLSIWELGQGLDSFLDLL